MLAALSTYICYIPCAHETWPPSASLFVSTCSPSLSKPWWPDLCGDLLHLLDIEFQETFARVNQSIRNIDQIPTEQNTIGRRTSSLRADYFPPYAFIPSGDMQHIDDSTGERVKCQCYSTTDKRWRSSEEERALWLSSFTRSRLPWFCMTYCASPNYLSPFFIYLSVPFMHASNQPYQTSSCPSNPS